ncbi:MAG: hypothetical protein ACKV2U_30590 [Bryobacteraceae bacterium]
MASLAKEMTALGYLVNGGNEAYALRRFQRRSLTDLRATKAGLVPACILPTYKGTVTGKADQATTDEVAVWTARGYVAPLGVYPIESVSGGKLRSDAAKAWTKLVGLAKSKGGTLDSPYGDTKRPLGKAKKAGASSFSFHIAGRAVDINQNLGGGTGQRYYIVQEASGGDTYWRLYCKTDDQTGAQGTKIAKGTVTAYRFGDGKTYKIPEGYYFDLTALIESTGEFERIRAQDGWGPSGPAYNKSEWWHFQWKPEKQETFHDECELVGITEADLRGAGYGDGDLDHRPG